MEIFKTEKNLLKREQILMVDILYMVIHVYVEKNLGASRMAFMKVKISIFFLK